MLVQCIKDSYPPRAIRAELDRLKNRGVMPADLLQDDALGSARMGEIYQRYQSELRRANALDFGDLILLAVRLFEHHPGVLEAYQRRWHYVLVDEYQDTNPIQYRFLRLLCDQHKNRCVVGDEDQSIYRFREADIRNILDFEKDFPGACVIRLERNYRSTQQILDLKAFDRQTGCGVLVNTSFNVRGEPVVCTPHEAFRCFARTRMDYLVLENCLLSKADIGELKADNSWTKEFLLD